MDDTSEIGVKEIVKYGAKWDLDEHEGFLWLWDSDGQVHEERIDDAEEMRLLVHLLQTEEPIFYHPKNHYLSTSAEQIDSNKT